jgi:hypothetical protein
MAQQATTHEAWYPTEEKLYVAFELSKKQWRVLCSAGGRKRHSGVMAPGSKKELVTILDRGEEEVRSCSGRTCAELSGSGTRRDSGHIGS